MGLVYDPADVAGLRDGFPAIASPGTREEIEGSFVRRGRRHRTEDNGRDLQRGFNSKTSEEV